MEHWLLAKGLEPPETGATGERQEQAGSEHLDSHFLSPEVREWGGNTGQGMIISTEAGPLVVPWNLADPTGCSWIQLRGR